MLPFRFILLALFSLLILFSACPTDPNEDNCNLTAPTRLQLTNFVKHAPGTTPGFDVTLGWDAVANADYYVISTNADLNGDGATNDTLQTTQPTITLVLPNTAANYQFGIAAYCNLNPADNQPGPVINFAIINPDSDCTPPLFADITPNTTRASVTVSIEPQAGILYYVFQYQTTNGFDTLVTIDLPIFTFKLKSSADEHKFTVATQCTPNITDRSPGTALTTCTIKDVPDISMPPVDCVLVQDCIGSNYKTTCAHGTFTDKCAWWQLPDHCPTVDAPCPFN